MSIEKKLAEMGVTVPAAPAAAGAYVLVKQVGNLVFLSGTLPMKDGALLATGKLEQDVTIEEGQACARQCAINMLAILKDHLGSLDKVKSVVKLTAFVASPEGFNNQPVVVNGASEFFIEVFGEAGKHTRVAVGTNELPLNVPVEIDGIFEV